MASLEEPITTDKPHLSGTPPSSVTSASFKAIEARKSNGAIINEKREMTALSNSETSKQTPTTSSNPRQSTAVTSKKLAGEVPSGSEPANSGPHAFKNDTQLKDSSKKRTFLGVVTTPIHFLRRNFRTLSQKITNIAATYDSDLSVVGDATDDDSDSSVDSDNNSRRSSNRRRTQNRSKSS
jgi:hypothetical protein